MESLLLCHSGCRRLITLKPDFSNGRRKMVLGPANGLPLWAPRLPRRPWRIEGWRCSCRRRGRALGCHRRRLLVRCSGALLRLGHRALLIAHFDLLFEQPAISVSLSMSQSLLRVCAIGNTRRATLRRPPQRHDGPDRRRWGDHRAAGARDPTSEVERSCAGRGADGIERRGKRDQA
jgi:hypothetical protein